MKHAGNNQFISNFHIKIQNVGNFTHGTVDKLCSGGFQSKKAKEFAP